MVGKELSKVGGRIPVEKFHVSPLNVRAGEPFGEAEKGVNALQGYPLRGIHFK